jgi:hypothetical protein
MISRNAATTDHGGSEELATQWNQMESPLISLSMWMIRNSRWQWINSADNNCEVATPWKIAAGAETDPAFDGVTIEADGSLEVFDTVNYYPGDGLNYNDIGNGVLLATNNTEDAIVMARWEANFEFYTGTEQYPANERIYYSVGTSDCGASGGTSSVFNLNEAGLTIFLNLVSEFIPLESDIEENTLKTNSLSLFPNPARSILRVDYKSDHAGQAVLSMADMTGKIVHRETINLIQGANNRYVNVSRFAKGVYTLSLDYENKQVITKVMVK